VILLTWVDRSRALGLDRFVAEDDLREYLRSTDGLAAEPWQLVTLASIRRNLGHSLPVRAYAALRSAIAKQDDLAPPALDEKD